MAEDGRGGSAMQSPIRVADKTFVLPTPFPVPGLGVLYINAMVIRGQEPILVETGAPVFRDEYLETAFSLVEPQDVRWIFLSHDDRDHSGNLMQVLEACPNARLVTNFVGVGRMSEEWDLPFPRLYFVNDGETFSAGDRTLAAIRPPYYDSPATRGLWDASTGVYFAADAFGAAVPHECEEVGDVPADVYVEGFNWFNRANSPWHEVTDPAKVNAVVDRVRALQPKVIVTTHGPSARDRSDQLCTMLAAIATMDPVVLPTQADFEHMLTEMAAPDTQVAPEG
jgi:flavorubredoxin